MYNVTQNENAADVRPNGRIPTNDGKRSCRSYTTGLITSTFRGLRWPYGGGRFSKINSTSFRERVYITEQTEAPRRRLEHDFELQRGRDETESAAAEHMLFDDGTDGGFSGGNGVNGGGAVGGIGGENTGGPESV